MFDALGDALTGFFSRIGRGGRLREEDVDEGLRLVRRALLEADVHYKVASGFVKEIRQSILALRVEPDVDPTHLVIGVVQKALVQLLGPIDQRIDFAEEGPTIIMIVGLQGSGKTTTCGKLARYLKQELQKSVLLVAADLQRPAAVRQLQVLGERLDVPVYAEEAKEGGVFGLGAVTPPKVCAKALAHAQQQGCDVVILDTAGRLQIDEELMKELAEIKKKTRPQNIFFVCDGMTGQDAVNSAKGFDERLSITGVVMTKLDGDARGGAALSVKTVTGKTIKFIGTGEKLEDLEELHPERLAGRILDMGDLGSLAETALKKINPMTAQQSTLKLLQGQWDLDDFLRQIEMVQSLGPLTKLMRFLPGARQMMAGVEIEDDDIKPVKAIISSMTRQERKEPELLDEGRRTRIARGSGTSPEQVEALVEQFEHMRDMMAQLGPMLGGGGLGGLLGGGGGLFGGGGGLFGGGGAPTRP